jgi:DNA-binding transcriptional regulator YiaG
VSSPTVDLRALRNETGLSRERAVRELDPPASAKTLERWEKGTTPIPKYRLVQVLALYARHNGKEETEAVA